MGILLGLCAALCWGSADFLARYATRLVGTYRTLFYMQFIGFVGITLAMIPTGGFARLAHGDWQTWLWAILAALLNMGSSLALYRAFEIGVLTIVSPIAASYAALTAVLALFSGESVNGPRALGMGAALLGVILAATSFAQERRPEATPAPVEPPGPWHGRRGGKRGRRGRRGRMQQGIAWAIAASLGYGVAFWMLGFHVIPALGGIAPVWLIRLATPIVLGMAALPARQSLRPPRGRAWLFLAGVGILDTLAFVSNSLALTLDQVSVVSILASLFSAVTVLLAWIFLRDRLQWSQWLGIGVIFAGVALVNV